MALYWALRLPGLLIRLLPLRLSYAVARAAGTLVYALWWGGRRRCVQNMIHVAGGDRALARRYARRSFAYYATYLVDFLRIGDITKAEVRESVAFDDWQRIEQGRSGNGIIFVSGHFGNWDLAGAVIAGRGLPVTSVADRFANRRVNEMVVGARERLGMSIVPAERMSTGILRALHRNDVVGFLLDVPWGDGIEVEFFGGTVSVPAGPARIALHTGAPIMVGGVWRDGPTSSRYDATVERVGFEATGDEERDIRALTQATMHSLERLVRRSPDQWYIFRNLWLEDRAASGAS